MKKTHTYLSTPPPVKATSESLHSLLDISPDAMVVVNQIGIIVMVNTQAEALFGYAPEEIGGQRLEVLLPERFQAPHQAHCQHYFAAPRPRPLGAGFQLFGKRKDGAEFPADISLRPLLLNEVLHVISAVRDLTRQKRIEEELQEQYRRAQAASRLKSEFLANMSHELRTPLNAIIGFTEMMYDGVVGQTSEAQHEYLGDILSSSRHLLQLINDVLDLARVEAGKMLFSPEEVDLERLVAEVRDSLRILIASKRIRFEAEIDPVVHGVLIDPARLKQVLYNYLSNALKFTSDEGRVTVRIRPERDDAFLIEVEDNGNGILPEDIGRLFVEFQQLDAGIAKKHQGTGLGLALTRRIVEAQGGSVGVRSIPGQGSTFFAALPRVNQAIEEFAAQEGIVS
jgi:PAS domain S-box-containing protein